MLKYLKLIQAWLEVFVDWNIEHIPRDENGEADALAKMAASLSQVSTREVLHVSRLILSTEEETLPAPEDSWMTLMIKFIVSNELPEDKAQAQKIKRQVPRFVLLNNVLYRRSFQGPLLKFLYEGEVDYVLREINEGCCGEHLEGVSLAQKAMLAGFWWPTISRDSARVVRDCEEAETLAKITEHEVLKFMWKNIVCRFGVPRRLISDNGRQFQGRKVTSWLHGNGKDWVEKLFSVLWAYRTTLRAPTQETHFNLVYGSEAVLPVEIGQSSSEVESYPDDNDQNRAMEFDLVKEKREQAMIRMEAYRGRVMKSYNKRV
ncbi:uncharacterized protein LOC142544357 [Primulina tabacum]|uniref:uncharacterized protein LOC142544357 n=1 Tax=Primulina tabacum TaxID=48773 RepID=UPI003F597BF5